MSFDEIAYVCLKAFLQLLEIRINIIQYTQVDISIKCNFSADTLISILTSVSCHKYKRLTISLTIRGTSQETLSLSHSFVKSY